MLTIVGTVFSVIGKILLGLLYLLLGLLALTLVVLLLVLCFPVSYRVKARFDRSGDREVTAKAHWLFGLVTVHYSYPKPKELIVRILGIRIKKKIRKQKKSADERQMPTDIGEKAEETKAVSNASDEAEKITPQVLTVREPDGGADYDSDFAESTDPTFFEKIYYKFQAFCGTIKEKFDTALYYFNLLSEEDSKQLMLHVMGRLGKILRVLPPRKIKGELLIGTGSPDTTGYVMAFYGMIFAAKGQNLIITPDFDEKVLEGNITAKGHVMLGVLAYHALLVILDKRLKPFTGKMKRRPSNGR